LTAEVHLEWIKEWLANTVCSGQRLLPLRFTARFARSGPGKQRLRARPAAAADAFVSQRS